jgi:hypothetical protein
MITLHLSAGAGVGSSQKGILRVIAFRAAMRIDTGTPAKDADPPRAGRFGVRLAGTLPEVMGAAAGAEGQYDERHALHEKEHAEDQRHRQCCCDRRGEQQQPDQQIRTEKSRPLEYVPLQPGVVKECPGTGRVFEMKSHLDFFGAGGGSCADACIARPSTRSGGRRFIGIAQDLS